MNANPIPVTVSIHTRLESRPWSYRSASRGRSTARERIAKYPVKTREEADELAASFVEFVQAGLDPSAGHPG